MVGSPSAVSDEQGRFELHFAVLKPGQAVKYNEIYKPGYILFNKEALEIWRISDNKTPFVVVMCREGEFRALKKKFTGLLKNRTATIICVRRSWLKPVLPMNWN